MVCVYRHMHVVVVIVCGPQPPWMDGNVYDSDIDDGDDDDDGGCYAVSFSSCM